MHPDVPVVTDLADMWKVSRCPACATFPQGPVLTAYAVRSSLAACCLTRRACGVQPLARSMLACTCAGRPLAPAPSGQHPMTRLMGRGMWAQVTKLQNERKQRLAREEARAKMAEDTAAAAAAAGDPATGAARPAVRTQLAAADAPAAGAAMLAVAGDGRADREAAAPAVASAEP